MTIDAILVTMVLRANMILRKRTTRTTNNLEEYQWYHEGTNDCSPWMNLDNALIWIKEHDESKETN